MTRANLNFIFQKNGEMPTTLFFYWNGDQYPSGLRDCYNVLELLENKITKKSFTEWIKKNYDGNKTENLGQGGQPKIYYTDGFITDYSYIFEEDKIKVFEWDKKIFDGTREQAINWFKKTKI